MEQQLICTIHGQSIEGICIEKSCKNSKLLCCDCINTTHSACSLSYKQNQFLNQLLELKRLISDEPTGIQRDKVYEQLVQQLKLFTYNLTKMLSDTISQRKKLVERIDIILQNQGCLTWNNWIDGYELLFKQIDFAVNITQITDQLEEIKNSLLDLSGQGKQDIPQGQKKQNKDVIVPNPNRNTRSIQSSHQINTLSLSPNGQHLASAGYDDCFIQIWDVSTGQQVGSGLQGHRNAILGIEYSPCGKFLLSCSSDQTIRQWDITNYEQIGDALIGHDNHVTHASYSQDSKYIVSCSSDNTLRVWNSTTGKEYEKARIIPSQLGGVKCMALSQNKNQVAYGSFKGEILIQNYGKRQEIAQPFIGHDNAVSSVRYSMDSELICSSSDDLTIRVWDVMTRKQIGQSCIGHTGSRILSASFSNDMKFIISGGDDKTVRVWNRFTGKQMDLLSEHHQDQVTTTLFSKDGKYLISGGHDRQIKITEMTIDEQ